MTLLEERDARGINDVYLLRFRTILSVPRAISGERTERFKKPKCLVSGRAQKPRWLDLYGTNLEWVLSRIKAKHQRPSMCGRRQVASPATGLASHTKHNKPLSSTSADIERELTMTRNTRSHIGRSRHRGHRGHWFKKPGDAVAVDEMLCELETDKVTVEVPAQPQVLMGDIVRRGRQLSALMLCWRPFGRRAMRPPAKPPNSTVPPDKRIDVMVPTLAKA